MFKTNPVLFKSNKCAIWSYLGKLPFIQENWVVFGTNPVLFRRNTAIVRSRTNAVTLGQTSDIYDKYCCMP